MKDRLITMHQSHTKQEPLTRKKPWNRANLPVYSICSNNESTGNMNIITYAVAVSMQPKRYICAIYHGSQTLENVEKNGRFVLQLLQEKQYHLIPLLGKKTGKKVNKLPSLRKKNTLQLWKGFEVLSEALALFEMKVIHSFDAGDHTCFLCDVTEAKNLHNGPVLGLDYLREKKLIRG